MSAAMTLAVSSDMTRNYGEMAFLSCIKYESAAWIVLKRYNFSATGIEIVCRLSSLTHCPKNPMRRGSGRKHLSLADFSYI